MAPPALGSPLERGLWLPPYPALGSPRERGPWLPLSSAVHMRGDHGSHTATAANTEVGFPVASRPASLFPGLSSLTSHTNTVN